MTDGVETAEGSRIARARAMTADATRLAGDDRFDSAILLHVTALEIIGEAMIRYLDLDRHIKSHGRLRKQRENHQLRHFVAASVAMAAVSSRGNGPVPITDVDFSGVRFERRTFNDNGRQGFRWSPVGGNAATTALLRLAVAPQGPIEEPAARMRSHMAFWAQAALGHCDNHRLAIIHQDNEFEFWVQQADGTKVSSREPDLKNICLWYAEVMPVIWRGLTNRLAMGFLGKHMPDVLRAFAVPLTTNSYHYPKT